MEEKLEMEGDKRKEKDRCGERGNKTDGEKRRKERASDRERKKVKYCDHIKTVT